MLLTIVLALPLIGAIAILLLPRDEPGQARHMGMFFSLVTFLTSLGLLAGFKANVAGMQFELNVPWVKDFGINYHVGIDGISLWLVMLTTFLTPIVFLSTYKHINKRIKEFVIALLLLEVGMLGAFMALDFFLFYVFWELMLIPMYLIIGIWGHERKIYAAIKFVIYTMLGSLLMLVAIIYIYITHGEATGVYTFDYMTLSSFIWGQQAQLWLFGAFALAFAIKVPMFPLHTWLPDAHVEAPTAGSVILAGVLLKLGTYGFLRFAIPMFPWGAAAMGPYITGLAVTGIIYGAMVAWVQRDAKKLVAYSSVSHLGFVMLGLMSMNTVGVEGSIFQMLSHGLSTGGLFLAIGVMYDRRHTRLLRQFGGLWKQMPVFGGVFMIIMLSSVGLPGLNGFVGEFLILLGSFTAGQEAIANGMPSFIWHPRVMTALAATGVVLGAIYLLHLFQKMMFGPLTHHLNKSLPDLSVRELATFIPLIFFCFAMGVYPKPYLKRMEPSVNQFIQEYKVKFDASDRYSGHKPIKVPELAAIRARGNRPAVAGIAGMGQEVNR